MSQGELLSCEETPLLYAPPKASLLKYYVPIPELPPLQGDLSLVHLYKAPDDCIFTFYLNAFPVVSPLFQSLFFSCHHFFLFF